MDVVHENHILSLGFFLTGVEFGARMVNIDGKQIKLQIWDTVRESKNIVVPNITVEADTGVKGYDGVAVVEIRVGEACNQRERERSSHRGSVVNESD